MTGNQSQLGAMRPFFDAAGVGQAARLSEHTDTAGSVSSGAEPAWAILNADCRTALASLETGSVHTCVTSPPYFGLRDYGVEGQIGLEQTPQEYVEQLVQVFREVRRVLRDDGTLWLNLGDSYAGSGRGGNPGGASTLQGGQGSSAASMVKRTRNDVSNQQREAATTATGDRLRGLIGEKQLLMMPARVALALQADGWILRQEIIWNKPNAMPESVTDRCTKAHEYIYLLSKSTQYRFDHEAIKEPAVEPAGPGNRRQTRMPPGERTSGENANVRGSLHKIGPRDTRNKRSVWTVTTKPYKGAHFATFPPDLIEPCVLAGAPAGGLVLDPFGGSGTTAAVALKHGRRAVICELNPEYVELARARIAAVLPHAFNVEDLA